MANAYRKAKNVYGGVPVETIDPMDLADLQEQKVILRDEPGSFGRRQSWSEDRSIAGPASNSEIARLLQIAGYKLKSPVQQITNPETGEVTTSTPEVDMEQFRNKSIPDLERLREFQRIRPSELDLSGLATLGSMLSSTGMKVQAPKPTRTADQNLSDYSALGQAIQDARDEEMKKQSDLFKAISGVTAVRSNEKRSGTIDVRGANPQPSTRGAGDGLKPPTAGEIDALSEAKSAMKSVDDAMKVIKENRDIIGPGIGTWYSIGKGQDSGMLAKAFGKGVSGLDPDAKRAETVRAVIDLARQSLGKPKEGGVLRKEDEIKYQNIIGDLTGNPKSIYIGLKNFRKELANRANERIRLMRSSKKAMGPEYDEYERVFSSYGQEPNKVSK